MPQIHPVLRGGDDVFQVSARQRLHVGIHELLQHRIAGAPVIDDHGNLVGMLSEFDCMKVVLTSGYHSEPGGPVSELMVTDVKTVDAGMSIVDMAELFLESGIRRYPVLKDNRLVGQISRRDVLRALGEISRH
jgi:CBS domain-containing protein